MEYSNCRAFGKRICFLAALILSIGACANTVGINECSWVKIITVSSKDVLTDQTAREILQHNEKVEAICPR